MSSVRLGSAIAQDIANMETALQPLFLKTPLASLAQLVANAQEPILIIYPSKAHALVGIIQVGTAIVNRF
jgi:hypothetical protein